jgi:hypothetical protein
MRSIIAARLRLFIHPSIALIGSACADVYPAIQQVATTAIVDVPLTLTRRLERPHADVAPHAISRRGPPQRR